MSSGLNRMKLLSLFLSPTLQIYQLMHAEELNEIVFWFGFRTMNLYFDNQKAFLGRKKNKDAAYLNGY